MIFERLPLGVYQANCYVIADEMTKECAVIDPGGEYEELKKYLNSNAYQVKYILLTHGHGDHIGAVSELRADSNAPVCIHAQDEEMLLNSRKNHSREIVGIAVEEKADILMDEASDFSVGGTKLEIIHTPGHTRGGVCIKCDNKLFSGDTLFACSIGRTDLEGGDYETIINSIKSKLLILPDETEVYPGHGPASSILIEKKRNPFLK